MYAGISGLSPGFSPGSSPAWRPHSKNRELETSQRREKKEPVSSVGRTGVLFPLTRDHAAKSQAGGQLGSGNTVLTHRRGCRNSGLRKWCLEEKPLPQQRMGSGVCGHHRHVFTAVPHGHQRPLIQPHISQSCQPQAHHLCHHLPAVWPWTCSSTSLSPRF